MSHLMHTYARLPVAFQSGKGLFLKDSNAKEYLDTFSGIAVNALGHAHPKWVQAIQNQVALLTHTSNIYEIDLQEQCAEKLCQLSGLKEVFFCNSGLEANEAAFKLARFFGHRIKNIAKDETPEIIVMSHAFHGRSLATLSATANPKTQEGFEPLVSGFVRVPFGDLKAIQAAITPKTAAVMLEVLQGEGGIYLADSEYLKQLRALCDENNLLLMCDEVQCGMARTGKWFAYQHSGIVPDVATLAKSLGNGIPVGACLAGNKIKGLWQAGNHGSTFGGNPLAMRSALATLEIIESENLLENAQKMGAYLKSALEKALANTQGVHEVRGFGLMIGIALSKPCADLVTMALKEGLLVNVTAGSVVRLLPALIISQNEADELVARLVPVIQQFLRL